MPSAQHFQQSTSRSYVFTLERVTSFHIRLHNDCDGLRLHHAAAITAAWKSSDETMGEGVAATGGHAAAPAALETRTRFAVERE